MFDVLRRKLSTTSAYPHLLSVLHHMLLVPSEFVSHSFCFNILLYLLYIFSVPAMLLANHCGGGIP